MKKVAKILYGSQNCGLDNSSSDKDYKLIVCPNFDELYNNKSLSAEKDEHHSYMDCRQFNHLFLKGNINVVELMFSVEQRIFNPTFEQYIKMAQSILKEGYLALVWPQFYSSTKGLVLNGLRRYENNSKSVARGFYYKNLLEHIAANSFEMNEETWRWQNFTSYARNVRYLYSEKELKEISDSIIKDFNDKKYENKMLSKAENFLKWNQEIKQLENYKNYLTDLTKQLVRSLL